MEILVNERLPQPGSVMELGAGTGAVIGELKRRGFARRYIAADYSKDACSFMSSQLDGIEVHRIDIVRDRIPERAEVVVLSHVLEHLEQPERLLEAIARNVDFDWFVVECPMEDLPASRLKNLFRDRLDNLAGHVQFFTPRSLRALVGRYFEIEGDRYYAPWAPGEVVDFISERNRYSAFRRAVSSFTMNWCGFR
ncbi:MAG: class I SAM-dependent methyltransferase [Betaproteobacteria bacterium]|nr:class I SAM-dependent methyltransferase [Betaproteobacteria bacterium]